MRRLVALTLWSLVCFVLPARATDLRHVITDITITSWNEKDGLPPATIMALAQDRDGYLWVGSRQGLFRFDGVRFLGWEALGNPPLPNSWVRALHIGRRGELWIGGGGAGQIARLADGALTVFGVTEGLPGADVLTIVTQPDGRVWAGTAKGLFTLEGARWVAADGLQDTGVVGLFVDADATLHVASAAGLFRGRAGRFVRVGDYADGYGGFAQTADGVVWVTDARAGYRVVDGAGHETPPWQGRGLRMLVDRKGNLWTGTGGQGLWRRRANSSRGAAFERATSLTGLLGDGVYALLEDRDGNIWAGTTEGLNRVTPRTIEQIIDLGLVRAVDADAAGRVWVGTADQILVYPGGAGDAATSIAAHADTRVVAADRDGAWVSTPGAVFHLSPDGHRTSALDIARQSLSPAEGLLPDGSGGVWMLTGRDGPLHWDGHRLDRPELPEAVRGSAATAAVRSREGRAWFAFANGRLAWTDGARWTLHGLVLPSGHTGRTFAETADGRLWLGGDAVLARIDGEQADVLLASPRFAVSQITAIVPDDRGSLWIGASNGVVHVSEESFLHAVRDARAAVRSVVYTRSDGVAGTPVAAGGNRGAVRARDGRLWFVTTRGLTVLDPHVLEARSAPVPIRLESVLADDRRLAAGPSFRLPAGTRTLEIDYTVVNLTAPLKPRFRYRLDPFDADWVEAGTRRQAFFTNLKPGAYVFRVAVSDVGGEPGVERAWPLQVAPHFYQTWAFAAAACAGIALAVLAGWRLRERHLRNQFAIIIAERARLGREIHDTLLQGLVAIALQFDSLAHELAPQPSLQARFLRLRDRVEEYIREARRSIWDLHTQLPHRSLIESLKRAGEFATDGRDIAFTLEIQGTPYQCPTRVEEQVVRIAQEASLNSVRHAAPRALRIALSYDDSALTLTVADDGRGFDAGQAREVGHYGLTSMQERARSVGGALTLVTAPGRGTEVTAVLPIAS
ncbi:MAG: two-component regulator propeller domain-containing protein [Vicinamibacterales bacterium]